MDSDWRQTLYRTAEQVTRRFCRRNSPPPFQPEPLPDCESDSQLLRLAIGGNCRAQYLAGHQLALQGDFSAARPWFLLSAAQGDPDGLCSLAFLYYNGYGLKQNPARGELCLLAAARQGDPFAAELLCRQYLWQEPVTYDRLSAALPWAVWLAARPEHTPEALIRAAQLCHFLGQIDLNTALDGLSPWADARERLLLAYYWTIQCQQADCPPEELPDEDELFRQLCQGAGAHVPEALSNLLDCPE